MRTPSFLSISLFALWLALPAPTLARYERLELAGAEAVRLTGLGAGVRACGPSGQPIKPDARGAALVAGDVVFLDRSAGRVPDVEPIRSVHARLAAAWAPAIFQDTDSSRTVADLITTVDYDGDWNTRNNWESLDGWHAPAVKSLTEVAAAYWWVVETRTHWFVGYGTYHPRDWEDSDGAKNWIESHVFSPIQSLRGKGSGQHENDLEGVLLTIRKGMTGSRGTLELMETQAHNHFWQYAPRGLLTSLEEKGKPRETIDGPIVWDGDRPSIFIEAKGHGIYGSPGKTKFDGKKGDGIVYRRAAKGSTAYALIPMSVLSDSYRKAPAHESETWASNGGRPAFAGDTWDANAANPPWAWVDRDYPASVNELFFAEPARFVAWRFRDARNRPFSLEVVARSCRWP